MSWAFLMVRSLSATVLCACAQSGRRVVRVYICFYSWHATLFIHASFTADMRRWGQYAVDEYGEPQRSLCCDSYNPLLHT